MMSIIPAAFFVYGSLMPDDWQKLLHATHATTFSAKVHLSALEKDFDA